MRKISLYFGVVLIITALLGLSLIYVRPYTKRFLFDLRSLKPGSSTFSLDPLGRRQYSHLLSALPKEPKPTSRDFGLVIPKIGANLPVVKDVDGTDGGIYYPALRKGVGHYKGTALPGQNGNSFIFGHSSGLPFAESDYKEAFLLLDKLQAGDIVKAYFEGKEYRYLVFENRIVKEGDFSVLKPTKEPVITLMTCWPPGTTLKRLVVRAKLLPSYNN